MNGNRWRSMVVATSIMIMAAVGCSADGEAAWPVVNGSLPSGETFSIALKGEPTDEDSFLPPDKNTIVSHAWSDGEEHMLFFVMAFSEEVRDDPDVDQLERAAAAIPLLALTLTTGALVTDESSVPASPETGPAGYEIRFESDEGPGVIRTVTNDLVAYTMISIDQSDEDTARFFSSLAFEDPVSDDAAPEAAAEQVDKEGAVASDTGAAADAFVGPPYGPRVLLDGSDWSPSSGQTAAVGTRPYQDEAGNFLLELVPPPTMAPPGTARDLDELWLRCGVEADGSACDELTTSAMYLNNNLYRAFGLSCGGRSRVEVTDCAAQLGS